MNRRLFIKAGVSLGALTLSHPAWCAEDLSPAAVLTHLRKRHPRLLASAEDFASLKGRIATDATMQAWQKKLGEDARKLLSAAPSRYEIPDGLRLLSTSRRVVSRVYTLGLMHWLEGKEEYAKRAWEELAAAADFQDWNPRHFLDTAEMTHAFAIGYDWLYEVWTPQQRTRLRTAMVEKGFKPALKLYRAGSGWTKARHNWNQVCNGGIGLGALALGDDEPELAAEILAAAVKSIQLAMAEFAPDGAWKEGPGYWDYATAYNVAFLAGLDSALGEDFGLSKLAAFDQTGLFPLYFTGPMGRSFNYADAGDHGVRSPQRFWLSRRFNQPVVAWSQRQVATPAPQDLLWYDPRGQGPKATGLPLDRYFRAAEVAVMRSEWENPQALFVGFKAGDNKANHSHLDLGSFVLDALEQRWVVDLGSDDYNMPGYFGGSRWTYYRLRAEGHNTLVLNPSEGADQIPSAAARITRFESKPEHAFAIADLTPAYEKHATRVWRGLRLLDRKQVLVQDELQAATAVEAWWFLHTPAAITLATGDRTANLTLGGRNLRAEILSPAGAKFQVLEAEPLPSSPHPPQQAKNKGVRKLAIHLEGVTDVRVAVRLVPLTAGDAPISPPEIVALARWQA